MQASACKHPHASALLCTLHSLQCLGVNTASLTHVASLTLLPNPPPPSPFTPLQVEVPLSTRGLPCVELFKALAAGLPRLTSLWVSCFTRFATEESAWVAEVPDTSMAVALALLFPPHVSCRGLVRARTRRVASRCIAYTRI